MPVTNMFSKRPTTKAARFGANNCKKTPPREKMKQPSRGHFLPNLVCKGEAANAPKMEPTNGTEKSKSALRAVKAHLPL